VRELVNRWINAVALMDSEKIAVAGDAIRDAGADSPGPHWRIIEHAAYTRCVAGGNVHDPDVRGSVLHACIADTRFFPG
jgi:hypothetical protein